MNTQEESDRRNIADAILTAAGGLHYLGLSRAMHVVERLTHENARLKAALRTLIIDANRLCDRQLGGTYEDDARRSIDAARQALAVDDQAVTGHRLD